MSAIFGCRQTGENVTYLVGPAGISKGGQDVGVVKLTADKGL